MTRLEEAFFEEKNEEKIGKESHSLIENLRRRLNSGLHLGACGWMQFGIFPFLLRINAIRRIFAKNNLPHERCHASNRLRMRLQRSKPFQSKGQINSKKVNSKLWIISRFASSSISSPLSRSARSFRFVEHDFVHFFFSSSSQSFSVRYERITAVCTCASECWTTWNWNAMKWPNWN